MSSDAAKQASMRDEVFVYVHVDCCRRSCSLAWYSDLSYTEKKNSHLQNPYQLLAQWFQLPELGVSMVAEETIH